MVSLFTADNSDVDGWIEGGHSDNTQISFAESTGRMYAEQDGISATNEFSAQWQAPPANSGELTFYVSGVAANDNNASSGDNSPTPIQISFTESTTTNLFEEQVQQKINIFPNPTRDLLYISSEITHERIELYQTGQKVKEWYVDGKVHNVALDDLTPGMYHLVFINNKKGISAVKKLVKL